MLQNIDVAGPFMMAINVSLIAAVIISLPTAAHFPAAVHSARS
jgi:Sec-independent protein secretion pathway component TatC